MRRFAKLGMCSLLAVTVLGCGSSTLGNMEMTSAVVGTTGGMVASSDGALQVAIPAGALSGDVMVTIEPTASPGSGSLGKVYEIGPTGTQFAMPVTLTLDYKALSLAGTDPSMLRVATFAAGSWQILSGASVDMQGQTVSGTTTHLSPYGITTAAAGAMCATVSGGTSCGGSGPAVGVDASVSAGGKTSTGPSGGSIAAVGVDGTGTTSTGGGKSASIDGGTSAPNGGDTSTSCVPSTCAEATNACASYPGATMTGCTDGPNGYMATCCFPSGGSICLAAGGSGNACTEDCSVGGSCTTTCPPAPTCATATTASACSGLTGATLQSCTDSGSGYTAACCFPPGAPVCTTVGAASSCGRSATGPTTCAPTPTCADAGNPCAGIEGATMQSCTDSADGYSAVCCLPVGVVPSAGSSSRGTVSVDGGVAGGSGSGTAGTSGNGPGAGGTIDPGTGSAGTPGGGTTGTTGGGGVGQTGAGGVTGGGGVIDPGTGSAGTPGGGTTGTTGGGGSGPAACKTILDCPTGYTCVAGLCETSGTTGAGGTTGGGGIGGTTATGTGAGGTTGGGGIGGTTGTGTAGGGGASGPAVCKSDVDCPSGNLCVAGLCEPSDGTTGAGGTTGGGGIGGTTGTGTTGAGGTTGGGGIGGTTGAAGMSGAACKSVADCSAGEACVNGICGPG